MTWPYETLVLVSLGGPWRHPHSRDVLQPVSFPTVPLQSLLFAQAASSCISVCRMCTTLGVSSSPTEGHVRSKKSQGRIPRDQRLFSWRSKVHMPNETLHGGRAAGHSGKRTNLGGSSRTQRINLKTTEARMVGRGTCSGI